MKKLIYSLMILFLQISLPGCGNDMVDFRNTKNDISQLLLTYFALPINGTNEATINETTTDDPTINPPVTSVPATGYSISRYGITWTFDKEYQYGQYANGDYWIKGPVTIIATNPLSIVDGNGYVRNGSVINPNPNDYNTTNYWELNQGYDSEISGFSYVPAYNIARPNGQNLSSSNPAVIPVNSSVVSTISSYSHGTGQVPYLTEVEILTVVQDIPSDGDFRPPYTGADKRSQFNINQLNYDALPSLTRPTANVPAMATTASYFERPWLDYVRSHVTRGILAINNGPWYGREYTNETAEAALMLSLNFTNTEKRTLLIRYVQLGLDLYNAYRNGATWEGNGGWMDGRKLPILFAGFVLNSSDILTNAGIHNISAYDGQGRPATVVPFQEDETFYVTQTDVDITHTTWPGGPGPILDYTVANIGMPEWGIQHTFNPSYDNKSWTADYRHLTGRADAGTALAATILSIKTQWNWQPFFDYMDQYMEVEEGVPDSVWRDYLGGQGSLFVKRMWELYRANYSPAHAPKSFTASPISSSQINLTWVANSKNTTVTGYKIFRSSDNGSNFNQIADVGAGVTNYHDTGLNTKINYYYWVKAYNSRGNSCPAWANGVTF